MLSTENIDTYANLVITQYQDDSLYHIADKFACSSDICEAIFWGQVFRLVTEMQNPWVKCSPSRPMVLNSRI